MTAVNGGFSTKSQTLTRVTFSGNAETTSAKTSELISKRSKTPLRKSQSLMVLKTGDAGLPSKGRFPNASRALEDSPVSTTSSGGSRISCSGRRRLPVLPEEAATTRKSGVVVSVSGGLRRQDSWTCQSKRDPKTSRQHQSQSGDQCRDSGFSQRQSTKNSHQDVIKHDCSDSTGHLLSKYTNVQDSNGHLLSKSTNIQVPTGHFMGKSTNTQDSAGYFLGKSTNTQDNTGHLLIKSTNGQDSNGHLLSESTNTQDSNGHLLSKSTNTQDSNGHLLSKSISHRQIDSTVYDQSKNGVDNYATDSVIYLNDKQLDYLVGPSINEGPNESLGQFLSVSNVKEESNSRETDYVVHKPIALRIKSEVSGVHVNRDIPIKIRPEVPITVQPNLNKNLGHMSNRYQTHEILGLPISEELIYRPELSSVDLNQMSFLRGLKTSAVDDDDEYSADEDSLKEYGETEISREVQNRRGENNSEEKYPVMSDPSGERFPDTFPDDLNKNGLSKYLQATPDNFPTRTTTDESPNHTYPQNWRSNIQLAFSDSSAYPYSEMDSTGPNLSYSPGKNFTLANLELEMTTQKNDQKLALHNKRIDSQITRFSISNDKGTPSDDGIPKLKTSETDCIKHKPLGQISYHNGYSEKLSSVRNECFLKHSGDDNSEPKNVTIDNFVRNESAVQSTPELQSKCSRIEPRISYSEGWNFGPTLSLFLLLQNFRVISVSLARRHPADYCGVKFGKVPFFVEEMTFGKFRMRSPEGKRADTIGVSTGGAFKPLESAGTASVFPTPHVVMVTKTEDGSVASASGCIEVGDIVVEVNGHYILNSSTDAVERLFDVNEQRIDLVLAKPTFAAKPEGVYSYTNLANDYLHNNVTQTSTLNVNLPLDLSQKSSQEEPSEYRNQDTKEKDQKISTETASWLHNCFRTIKAEADVRLKNRHDYVTGNPQRHHTLRLTPEYKSCMEEDEWFDPEEGWQKISAV